MKKNLKKPDNIQKLEKLKSQIEKLEAIGGASAIVPSEGLVFKYKGNLYKFTGAFAPINQIVGSLKFYGVIWQIIVKKQKDRIKR